MIQLTEDGDALGRSFMTQFAEGIDVVIDYLWGASAEWRLIVAAKAGAEAVPIRFVQVGSVSAQEILQVQICRYFSSWCRAIWATVAPPVPADSTIPRLSLTRPSWPSGRC
jgi:hypothetical protein